MASVELVHATSNAEHLIVDMARVSNPANQGNYDTAPRLLRYLIRHKHWSPFEMASMCVKINTERDIAAQIIRHRSFSFQEKSTRYAKTDPINSLVLRRQDSKNRQASHDDLPVDLKTSLEDQAKQLLNQVFVLYEHMLDQGVAKETARRILPLATPTTLYMHGTLRSWIHYFEVRCTDDTQLEHQMVASQCKQIFASMFPVIHEAIDSIN